MPKLPRWTAIQAERALLAAGLERLRSKGSHRIYGRGALRVTVPFHSGAALHPKIIKQVLEIIEEAGRSTATDQ
ncbi:MAG: type II toxin-antitoxin system HicA family toxin [Bryobacteraceae bacterium]|nr:type II toxin-antitoxin system HicA family toxin [Bryobacteraceae bacterium]